MRHALTPIKTNAVEIMLVRQIRRSPQSNQRSRARDGGAAPQERNFAKRDHLNGN